MFSFQGLKGLSLEGSHVMRENSRVFFFKFGLRTQKILKKIIVEGRIQMQKELFSTLTLELYLMQSFGLHSGFFVYFIFLKEEIFISLGS